jgi:glycosyltransferase involved in cell wall biosynthesis
MAAPLLSVVIPLYNREREIRRAIASCLAQQGADFEVIVVDDASTDGSAATAANIAEHAASRVRLIRHPANLGSSPARTSGMRAAAGAWIVRLDSDDELVPGALAAIQRRAAALPANVGRLGFMYRYQDGRESPFPPPDGRLLDYAGFISWLERSETFDCLIVTRTSALAAVPLPAGRLMEMLHHLDFARRFDTLWVPEVGAIYHVDAGLRQSKGRSREEALQDAEEIDLILRRHGKALERLAPRFRRAQLRQRAVSLALAGERRRAVRQALAHLASRPLSPLAWAALGGVALGGAPLSAALRLKWWLVEERRKRLCRPAAATPTAGTPGAGP